jgi:hypothetical protein
LDARLEERARAIERQRADLQRAQAFLQGCHGCPRPPVRAVCDACALGAGFCDISVLRVVWDEPPRD